mmetsp:Transcript_20530/g.38758  ORF Transcript_20530/g.38758 Transcript_20530/m.38758 type:complete len:97 (+) Transcript_20530:175-465(+)
MLPRWRDSFHSSTFSHFHNPEIEAPMPSTQLALSPRASPPPGISKFSSHLLSQSMSGIAMSQLSSKLCSRHSSQDIKSAFYQESSLEYILQSAHHP